MIMDILVSSIYAFRCIKCVSAPLKTNITIDWHRRRDEEGVLMSAWSLKDIYGAKFEKDNSKEMLQRWFKAWYINILGARG
jgi:hypothetical protein